MDLTVYFIIIVSTASVMAIPPEKAKEVNQLFDEVVAIVESEISASVKQLLENGTKFDSPDIILKIIDIGFNVLTKVYGKLRNLWELGTTSEDVRNLIVQRIESFKVPGSEISERSGVVNEDADKESTFVKSLKQSAIKLVKFILSYNNSLIMS
uniref:Uncharacterized protein n=1 Tax=Cuerna arida TaxID=1464854 RepID=A0A1B6GYU3_9HEMI